MCGVIITSLHPGPGQDRHCVCVSVPALLSLALLSSKAGVRQCTVGWGIYCDAAVPGHTVQCGDITLSHNN